MSMGAESGPAVPRGADAATLARQALERDLASRGAKKWLLRVVILAGVAAAVWGGRAYYLSTRPAPPPRFTTQKVVVKNISEEVQSTGKVKPLKEVQVGAQVSGRVIKVNADFNSRVTKGEVLAEIDPRVLSSQVTQVRAQILAARAQVKRAEAALVVAETVFSRQQRLIKENLTTQAEVDAAEGNRNVAKADVAANEASLAQLAANLASASTTLQYTRILSPIDGVVITRSIDPGQTVAASFTAPVLFVIAPDLERMQVMAEIDEADVGKVKEKMEASVVVDAFPGKTFRGAVSQIRFSPNEVQGVVTYSAMVDVANSALELRPGMTATVTIVTRKADQVNAVPNAALRFRPVSTEKTESGVPPPPVFATELKAGQGRVYVPGKSADEAAEKVIELGVTDGRFTEVQGGLAIGDAIITEQKDAKRPEKFLGLF